MRRGGMRAVPRNRAEADEVADDRANAAKSTTYAKSMAAAAAVLETAF